MEEAGHDGRDETRRLAPPGRDLEGERSGSREERAVVQGIHVKSIRNLVEQVAGPTGKDRCTMKHSAGRKVGENAPDDEFIHSGRELFGNGGAEYTINGFAHNGIVGAWRVIAD